MLHSLRRPSPALIVAIAALFLALAGTAAAAVIVDSPDDLGPNVVTTPAIANKAVTASKLAPGATPNVLSAKVDEKGNFLVGHVALGSSRTSEGHYQVRFNRDIQNCTMTATARDRLAVLHIDRIPVNPRAVVVNTSSLANFTGGALFTASDAAFDLWGVC